MILELSILLGKEESEDEVSHSDTKNNFVLILEIRVYSLYSY